MNVAIANESVMTTKVSEVSSEFVAANYCVSFIDLLGQRDAARGQGLVPNIKSEAEDKAFQKSLRDNIGGIVQLQRDVEEMIATISPDPNSILREELSEENKVAWDEILRKTVKTQYWSDGFVRFIRLAGENLKCPVVGVLEIFCTAGYFCLLGLARRRPVRGAIAIAWGVEIRPGELYGPAVARAYELESEIAQYPRIVVGQEIIRLLEAYKVSSGDDPIIRANREFAKRSLELLVQDDDGNWIIHYLGEAFQWSVTHNNHGYLYQRAREFVIQQAEMHKKQLNTKLAFRYCQLLAYFDAHPASA